MSSDLLDIPCTYRAAANSPRLIRMISYMIEKKLVTINGSFSMAPRRPDEANRTDP